MDRRTALWWMSHVWKLRIIETIRPAYAKTIGNGEQPVEHDECGAGATHVTDHPDGICGSILDADSWALQGPYRRFNFQPDVVRDFFIHHADRTVVIEFESAVYLDLQGTSVGTASKSL